MKILAIIPSYKPAYLYGGPILSVSTLYESVSKAGHTVCVLTTDACGTTNLPVEYNRSYLIDGVEVFYFHRWTGDHSNFSPGLLFGLWKRIEYFEVVHIHSWWNLVTIPSVLICLLQGIRPVLSPRGSITQYTIKHRKSSIKRLVHKVIGKRLLERVTIHSTSLREDNEVARFVQNTDRHIIPNLFPYSSLQLDFQEDPNHLRLVFLGRLDRVKNLEYLISELINHVAIPYKLTIIGDGEKEYVESLKELASKCNNITWKGTLDGEEKFLMLAKSDLLLLPSHTENFGNVIVEALSQGTPVMISDQVGIKDYIIENEIGWVIPTLPSQWAKKLNEIWDNRSQLTSLRKKAISCVKRDFDTNKLTESYLRMYSENIRTR